METCIYYLGPLQIKEQILEAVILFKSLATTCHRGELLNTSIHVWPFPPTELLYPPPPPAFMLRSIYVSSFRLSVCSFLLSSVTFVEFTTKLVFVEVYLSNNLSENIHI